MNLQLWFPQPIWFKDYDVDFSKAIEYIQKLKTSNPGRKRSNMGGWQSEDINIIEVSKELEEPFNVILSGVKHVAQDLQQYGFGNFYLTNAWINVNKGTDYNREHVHPLNTFSGCLYLKTSSSSGAIEFSRPDNMKLYPGTDNKTDIFYSAAHYKPVSGKLLIFPAWLSHTVLPSENNEERISIAFNILNKDNDA
jgi:uncharacterized protein (TIGR02466 family)